MPNYFARVELHGAEWPNDYEFLHRNLARIGFTSCHPLLTGGSLKLPTGLYFAEHLTSELNEVAQRVCTAADSTGYESEVVVILSDGARCHLSSPCD